MLLTMQQIIYLTNAICEETGHSSPEMMRKFGLNYGVFDGKNVRTVDLSGKMKLAGEYYPLNEVENGFIADDTMGFRNAWGLLGYSAFYDGHKYAMPSLEVYYFNPNLHREDERDTYLSESKAKEYTHLFARHLEEIFQSSLIDGHIMICESDGMNDRNTIGIMLPFDYLAERFPNYEPYKKWLINLIQRFDEEYDVPKAMSA